MNLNTSYLKYTFLFN